MAPHPSAAASATLSSSFLLTSRLHIEPWLMARIARRVLYQKKRSFVKRMQPETALCPGRLTKLLLIPATTATTHCQKVQSSSTLRDNSSHRLICSCLNAFSLQFVLRRATCTSAISAVLEGEPVDRTSAGHGPSLNCSVTHEPLVSASPSSCHGIRCKMLWDNQSRVSRQPPFHAFHPELFGSPPAQRRASPG